MESEYIINTQQDGERVTSSYAEIFFDEEYCDYKQPISNPGQDLPKQKSKSKTCNEDESEWISPSDLLIGKVDLKPPFTSKITRGKTHEGILNIGNNILEIERGIFVNYLNNLIYENDSAWNHILEFEKAAVVKNMEGIFAKIFEEKSKIMSREMLSFYEKTLCDLERDVKLKIENILISTHANIVSKTNIDIKEKLKNEKNILEKVLKKRYESEVAKLKTYYSLLLNNEKLRSKHLIEKTIVERNEAIKAFIRQIEAENTSSTMYVMCTERKKCKIKQFLLENYQSQELKEKYKKLKERQDVIDMFKEREVPISQINTEWEDKIKKILQLFLKFISFSLKLIPEQTSFLINFEKMVVLQLNDLQKTPYKKSAILVDKDDLANNFKFEQIEEEQQKCIKEPFVVTGGYLSGTPSTQYGSRETIPDDVDLPAVRLQRQLIYAKCHNYEEIKAKLDAERCKCMDQPKQTSLPETKLPKSPKPKPSGSKFSDKSKSTIEDKTKVLPEKSFEHLIIDDIGRLNECPGRYCHQGLNSLSFPNLNAYLDFDDEKYERVITILGKTPPGGTCPEFISPKEIINKELPFAATKEPYHNVETQYSSQEDISAADVPCTCVTDYIPQRFPSHHRIQESQSRIIADNMTKRKISLRRLLQQNPELLKTFTDESFDFIY